MDLLKNIIFMGSDPIALPLLDFIFSQNKKTINLKGIFTQPDRPKGRGKKMEANPIKKWALAHNIPVYQPERIGDTYNDWVMNEKIDLACVMAYGQILKKSFLEALPMGAINWHGSILPFYRGASPVESALLNREAKTGLTLMKIIPKMDAGPILDIETIQIDPRETQLSLRQKMANTAVSITAKNWEKILTNKLTKQAQQEELASYTHKIKKEDGILDFSLAAKILEAKIRAFNPWPACSFTHNQTVFKVWEAEVLNPEQVFDVCGQVLNSPLGTLHITSSKGILSITKIQRPGGKILEISEFLRGYIITDCILYTADRNET